MRAPILPATHRPHIRTLGLAYRGMASEFHDFLPRFVDNLDSEAFCRGILGGSGKTGRLPTTAFSGAPSASSSTSPPAPTLVVPPPRHTAHPRTRRDRWIPQPLPPSPPRRASFRCGLRQARQPPRPSPPPLLQHPRPSIRFSTRALGPSLRNSPPRAHLRLRSPPLRRFSPSNQSAPQYRNSASPLLWPSSARILPIRRRHLQRSAMSARLNAATTGSSAPSATRASVASHFLAGYRMAPRTRRRGRRTAGICYRMRARSLRRP